MDWPGYEKGREQDKGCDWARGSGWNAGDGHQGAQIARINIHMVRQRNLLKTAQHALRQMGKDAMLPATE